MPLYPAEAPFGPCRDHEPSKEGTRSALSSQHRLLSKAGSNRRISASKYKVNGINAEELCSRQRLEQESKPQKNLSLSFYCIISRGRCQDLLVHLKKALPRSGCNTKRSARKWHQILPDREKQVRSLQCREDKTPHRRAPDSQEGPSLLSSIAVFGGTSSFNPAQFQLLAISHEPRLREWETGITSPMIYCRGMLLAKQYCRKLSARGLACSPAPSSDF